MLSLLEDSSFLFLQLWDVDSSKESLQAVNLFQKILQVSNTQALRELVWQQVVNGLIKI